MTRVWVHGCKRGAQTLALGPLRASELAYVVQVHHCSRGMFNTKWPVQAICQSQIACLRHLSSTLHMQYTKIVCVLACTRACTLLSH